MTELDERVLACLQSTSRPRSLRQIGTAVGHGPRAVAESLHRLQQQGAVRCSGRLWTATARRSPRTRLHDENRTSNGDPSPDRGDGPPPSNIAGSGLSRDPRSRWRDFRRLCGYYADCIRIEERPRLTAYLSAARPQYLELTGRVDWTALAAGQAVPVALTADQHDRVARLIQTSGSRVLYLGAPAEIFEKTGDDGYRSLTPLFVQRVLVSRSHDRGIELAPLGTVEVNHGWIERAVPNSRTRRELLEAIGLESGSGDADDDMAEWLVRDFTQAVRRLLELRKAQFVEYPRLDRRPIDPPLAKVTEPGTYNRAVLLPEPRLQYADRLYKELRKLADDVPDAQLDQTALVAMFPHSSATDSPSAPNDPAPAANLTPPPKAATELPTFEYCILTEEQMAACQSALAMPLTTITGPPGTGKSVTVTHIVMNATLREQKVLFASRNHQALEAVEPRVNAMVDPEVLMLRASRRSGDDQVRFQWAQAVSELLARPGDPDARPKLDAASARLREAARRIASAEQQLRMLAESRERLAQLRMDIRTTSGHPVETWLDCLDLEASWPDAATVEELCRELDFVTAQGGGFLDRLRRRMRIAVRGRSLAQRRTQALEPLSTLQDPDGPKRDAGGLDPGPVRRLLELISIREDVRNAVDLEERLRRMPSRGEIDAESRKARTEQEAALRSALAACAIAWRSDVPAPRREEFATIRAALRNRGNGVLTDNDELAKKLGSAIEKLYEHFPIWAVTNLSTGRVAPLSPGIFDVAIVDEASQCDIPSIIPILFRAKRSVVVGDPNQLPHVVKMKPDTDMRVRRQYGVESIDFERFTYRANSAFDLASGSPMSRQILLRDHHRCHPDIASYSNEHFYSGQLRVRTSPGRPGSSIGPRAVMWTHVEDDCESAPTGAVSRAQQQAVIEELRRLETAGFVGTVGVVTPFRHQADRIRDLTVKEFDRSTRERWRLTVSTADGFQGDERDVILFSLVGGPRAPQGSIGFLANERNRFNVAVSRARSTLHVFGDRNWAATCDIPHVRTLLHHIEQIGRRPEPGVRTDLIGPVWEPLFAKALAAAGIEYEQQYPTAGYYLDFAIFDGSARKLAVEIDGEAYHRDASGMRRHEDLYRDQNLVAAGWDVKRFWVYELRESIDECVGSIRQWLADAGPESGCRTNREHDAAALERG